MSRRAWLGRTLTAAAAVVSGAVLPRSVRGQPLGANDAVRLAVAGLRTRGAQLIEQFRMLPGVRLVALCDVDSDFLDREKQRLSDAGCRVDDVRDFRRLLDRNDVDAVVIATPDHWHALMTVWACQAGKDVYVEKPVSHNIWEGRRMVIAARQHQRIVQAGTQNRSDVGFQQAAAYLHRGELGPMKFVWVINYVPRESIGHVDGPQPVPASVDYDLFLGPAERAPLRRKNLHYDWHWFWSTGTGECGNRGVHAFDHVRWLMGEDRLPTHIQTIGGRIGWDDDGETPNTQITLFEGLKVPVLYELRNLPRAKDARAADKFRGHATTMFIECEHGYVVGGRGFMQVFAPDKKLIRRFECDSGRDHPPNFIAAMRSRDSSDLHADIEVGHISSAYCHLANVSHRSGQQRPSGEIARAVRAPAQFAEAFARLQQHLDANGVRRDQAPLTLGPRLTFDTAKEQFIGDNAETANAFLRRSYRPPFIMPAV